METPLIMPPPQKSPIRKDSFEKDAWLDQRLVCGVDEVGRGCLAGPLVTAAVILHPKKRSPLLKDSKIMSREDLVRGAAWVVKNSWYGFGIISHAQIDIHNIYQATLIAMKRAVMQALTTCPYQPSAILVDAMPLKLSFSGYEHIAVHHFTQGESKSSSIAAASIIAKVKRDALISRLDQVFPGYQLASHKGYATDTHCTAVRAEGKSLIHRSSFLENILTHHEDPHAGEQITLF